MCEPPQKGPSEREAVHYLKILFFLSEKEESHHALPAPSHPFRKEDAEEEEEEEVQFLPFPSGLRRRPPSLRFPSG
eukprot:776601-Pyramimonas_sp.AAC.1